MENKRLGKGLNQLFGQDVTKMLDEIQSGEVHTESQEQAKIKVADIRPNPYQPRKIFDDQALQELSQSIQQHGVFTPILVKKSIQGYDLIAGERRLRASKLAGLEEIPAIVVEMSDQEMMEIALLENIQREDLNPLEEAAGIQRLLDEFNMTHETASQAIGRSNNQTRLCLMMHYGANRSAATSQGG